MLNGNSNTLDPYLTAISKPPISTCSKGLLKPCPPNNLTRFVSFPDVTFKTTPFSSPRSSCDFLTTSKSPFTTGFGNTICMFPIT